MRCQGIRSAVVKGQWGVGGRLRGGRKEQVGVERRGEGVGAHPMEETRGKTIRDHKEIVGQKRIQTGGGIKMETGRE